MHMQSDKTLTLDSEVQQVPREAGSISAKPAVVGRPNVLNREVFLYRVEQILDRKIFSNNGPLVQELEAAVAKHLCVPHVIAISNATAGLELVLQSLELEGDVILPAFTFVATAHAIKRSGLNPVFCDVSSDQGLIDPAQVHKLITNRTAAILPVNLYGNVCAIEALEEICKEQRIKLIFDSAHALGVKYKNSFVGNFGDAEIFSLHATKFINGFEGGLITTSDNQLAEKLRSARNFGFVNREMVNCVATNAKLSEIHAAMALTNFEYIDEILTVNRRNYEYCRNSLPSWLKLIEFREGVKSNFQYITVLCPPELRDSLIQHLHKNQIFVRRYFYPGLHKLKPYLEPEYFLPNTDALAEQVICLPTGQDVDFDTIQSICTLVNQFYNCR
jgi:dTDP-4-amino-4,6-dideoxygalactose transaminase